MRWIDALKEWNRRKGGAWCVPRKGTAENAEVRKIMGGAAAERKKKEDAEEAAVVEKLKAKPKLRPVLKKKEAIAEVKEVAEEMKPIIKKKPFLVKKKEAAAVVEEVKEVVKKVRPVLKKKEVVAVIAKAVGETPAAVVKALEAAPTPAPKKKMTLRQILDEGRMREIHRMAEEERQKKLAARAAARGDEEEIKKLQAELQEYRDKKKTGGGWKQVRFRLDELESKKPIVINPKDSLLKRMDDARLRYGGQQRSARYWDLLTKDEFIRRLKLVGDERYRVIMGGDYADGRPTNNPTETLTIADIQKAIPSDVKVQPVFRNRIMAVNYIDKKEEQRIKDFELLTSAEYDAKYGE